MALTRPGGPRDYATSHLWEVYVGRMTRREFLFLGAAVGATAAVGVVVPISITARDTVGVAGEGSSPGALVGVFRPERIASLADLEVGVPVTFDYPAPGQTNYLVKLAGPTATGQGPDEDLVAFSRICTHMGCLIDDYNAATATLGPCPCHFTTFDFAKDGGVILGQATQNLPRILLDVEDDDISATGVMRLIYGYNNTLLDVASVGSSA